MNLKERRVAKLLSLLLALVLVWYVQVNKTVSRDIQVRVEKPRLPGGLIIASKIPVYLNVKLKGAAEHMDFPVSDYRIMLTNPNPRAREEPGRFRTILLPELPNNIQAKFQSLVELKIDKLNERILPILPELSYIRTDRLFLGPLKISPRTIRVRGPARILSGLNAIRTQKIQVEGKPGDFRTRVFIQLPEFVTTAPGQPLDIEFSQKIQLMNELKGQEENTATIPGESEKTGNSSTDQKGLLKLENVSFRCANKLPEGYTSETQPFELYVNYPVESKKPEADDFEIRAYCAHEFGPLRKAPLGEKVVKTLENVAVYVEGKYDKDKVEILGLSRNHTRIKIKTVKRTEWVIDKGCLQHSQNPENCRRPK